MAQLPKRLRSRYERASWFRFEDEAPRIGSGLRPVIVISVGPQWVRIESIDGAGTRLPRRAYDALMKGART